MSVAARVLVGVLGAVGVGMALSGHLRPTATSPRCYMRYEQSHGIETDNYICEYPDSMTAIFAAHRIGSAHEIVRP